jgi:hypothetical protein
MSLAFLLGLMMAAAPPRPARPVTVPEPPMRWGRDTFEGLPVGAKICCGGADSPPVAPPERPHDALEYVPPEAALPQIESLALTTEEAERLNGDSRLSARERWCRSEERKNSPGLLDVLTLHAEVDDCPGEVLSDASTGCLMFGLGVSRESGLTGSIVFNERNIDFAPGPKAPWTLSSQPAFIPLLLESLRIRTSDRTPHEKGRRIARLIKPWMTHEQIHALFGESRSVLWDLTQSRITYVDYGVSIDRCGGVTFRDDSPQARNVWWDWITPSRADRVERVDFGNLYWE